MKFLYKRFIKDYKNTKDPQVRQKYGFLSGTIGIISNVILVIIKLLIGILVNSISLIGDALNNIGDTLSSFINLFSFKINGKPADKKHPYGHRRSEYVGGLLISFIIIIVALELATSSIDKIMNPSQTIVSWYLWLVLGINMLIKIFMAILYRNSYKAINSISLQASYKDSLNDILTTLIIIIGLYSSEYFNFDLDGYLGLALSVFIIVSGIKLIKEAIDKLIGEAVDDKIVNQVRLEILEDKDIFDIHDVLAHEYGEGKIFMSLHAEMDANLSLLKAHEIVDKIERLIKKKYGIELLIHIDPIDFSDEEFVSLKRHISNIVENIDCQLSIHDVRIIRGKQTRVYFDLAMPYDYMSKSKETIDSIISEINKVYNYKISIEINYK